MNNLINLDFRRLNPRNRQPGSSLLGLSFDGSHLQAVEVRRTNGSVEIRKTFDATLSLDPIASAPELAGREIRKVLDEQGVSERWCTVSIPLNWALTLSVKLPELAEADVDSFLQLEAERGFPYSPDALLTARSRYVTPSGEAWATLIAVPRNHLTRLEQALTAAQLRAASISIGITALQPADAEGSDGVLAIVPGADNIRMQLTLGGGIAVMRTIEGAFDSEGTERQLQVDHILRELRITLGQLAPELRESVKSVRVFGNSEDATELAEVMQPRLEAQGLVLKHLRTHDPKDFPIKLPPNTPVSPALALAMRRLSGVKSTLEFLPPKISAWQRFSSKYSSPRLVTVGVSAGAVAAVVLLAFIVQQGRLWYWGYKWKAMQTQVTDLKQTGESISAYRAWYDSSFRELAILEQLTLAFPTDATVSTKQIEIRDPGKPGELPQVTCTGTARTRRNFLDVKEKLGASKNVLDIHTENERGTSPMEFTFNFKWIGGGR
jgi:hypothetical protein